MTLDQITTWIHTYTPRITIEPQIEFYSGLQVTVLLNGKTVIRSGQGEWDLVKAIGDAITEWEKQNGGAPQ